MLFDIGLGIVIAMAMAKWLGIGLEMQLIVISVAFSLLPDIDALAGLIKGKVGMGKWAHEHRDLLHYPLVYIPAGALALLVVGPIWSLLFVVTSLMHFIHDSIGIGWGVHWLAPLSPKAYMIWQVDTREWFCAWTDAEVKQLAEERGNEHWIRDIYFRWHPVGVVETGVFVAALVALWLVLR